MKEERKKRQHKLANLFFEMGMDLDLIEQVSGVEKRDIIQDRLNKAKDIPLTVDKYHNNVYLGNKNSFM